MQPFQLGCRIPFVTFAYNSSLQQTTSYSPFRRLYGRAATVLFDTVLPRILMDDYTTSPLFHAETVRQLARLRTWESQQRQQVRASDVHLASYNVGDLMWV